MRLLIHHEFKCDRGEIEAFEFSLIPEEGPETETKREAVTVFADLEEGTTENEVQAQNEGEDIREDADQNPVGARTSPEKSGGKKKKKKRRLSKTERDKLAYLEKVQRLDKEGLRTELTKRILKLHASGALSLPPLAWDGVGKDEKVPLEK